MLAGETLANLWSFTKFANVFPHQYFPLYSIVFSFSVFVILIVYFEITSVLCFLIVKVDCLQFFNTSLESSDTYLYSLASMTFTHPNYNFVFCTVNGIGTDFQYGVWGYGQYGHYGPTQPVEFLFCRPAESLISH